MLPPPSLTPLDREAYEARVALLRADLLDAQVDVGQAKQFPVLILINGFDTAGRSEMLHLLNEWMDPRHVHTVALPPPSRRGRHRPWLWRHWQGLPARGGLGVLFGGWCGELIEARLGRSVGRKAFERRLQDILGLETMLAAEGALILKFWFHVDEGIQAERLRKLSEEADTRWRVTKDEWRRLRHYGRHLRIVERLLVATHTSDAPWVAVDGACPRARAIHVGTVLLNALRQRLVHPPEFTGADREEAHMAEFPPLPTPGVRPLMAEPRYEALLEKYQGRLARLARELAQSRRSLVVVFEGMDAAGKGGAIRRVASALDARQVRIVPVAAPTDEERGHHYLWRFWRQLPAPGCVTIFDRSWYGRVLVERVEGYSTETQWRRAYREIAEFEGQLDAGGIVVVKLWLQVSPDEQLRRFRERESTRFKRFKITPDDWRNREKAPRYAVAVQEMLARTSSEAFPWKWVDADDKYRARVQVLKHLCDRLEAALG